MVFSHHILDRISLYLQYHMHISILLLVLENRIQDRTFLYLLCRMHIAMVLVPLAEALLEELLALHPLRINSVHLLHLLALPCSFP